MIKSSTLFGYFRELMVGENQCGRLSEWTFEPQTEPIKGSRLWRTVSSLQETGI